MSKEDKRQFANETPPAESRAFGRYRVVRHLATGGMGEVYLVRLADPGAFRRLLVLKTIRPELVSDHEYRIMFEQEAQIAGSMDHANICRAFEFGYEQGRPYMVMEYLRGVGMDVFIRQVSRTPDLSDVRVSLSLLLQACHGLHYAHDLKGEDGQPAAVVHRDVTPGNLMVSREGVLRILDFGIARTRAKLIETRTGAIKGKYCYMPPEQVQGHPIDRRADVFSLGVLMWEAIAGRSLFSKASEYETIRAVVEESPPRLDQLRPGLINIATVVARALHKSRSERFETARALGHALVAAMQADKIGAPLIPLLLADELQRRVPVLAALQNEFVDGAVPSANFNALPEPRRTGTTAIDLDPQSPDERLADLTAVSGRDYATTLRSFVIPLRHVLERGPVLASAAAFLLTLGGAVMWRHFTAEKALVEVPNVPSSAFANTQPATPPKAVVVVPPVVAADIPSTQTDPEVASVTNPTVIAAAEPQANRSKRVARGSLTVEARPYGTVFVDGKKVAVTPLVKHRLKPGTHRIKVVGSNGKSDAFVIQIKPGEDAPPRLIMLE